MFFRHVIFALAVVSSVAALPMPMRRLKQRDNAPIDITDVLTNTTIPVMVGGHNSTDTNSTITIGLGDGGKDNSTTNVPQGGNKVVMAHYMVGNAYVSPRPHHVYFVPASHRPRTL